MHLKKIRAAGVPTTSATNFIGEVGTLFYDHDTGILRISDGHTPGGSLVYQDLSNIIGDIIPSQDVTYDLGSPSHQWRSLYVGTSTIYINNIALSINTGGNLTIDGVPIVSASTSATTTSTLVAGTYTFALSNTGTVTLNGLPFVTSTSATTTSTLVAGTYTFALSNTGTLTLPAGGTIAEGGGFTGAIKLTPAGGANAYQALLIYPTAAGGDGDHIHLTAGGGSTELYLGNDIHYVKLVDGGDVEVQASTGTYSATSAWTFGTDGRLVNVDGLTLTAGGQFNICTILTGGSGYNTGSALKATTGGSGTGMTVGIGYGLSNQLANVTVVDPGTGYVNGDVITVSGGSGGTFILTQYNELGNQGNNNFVQSNWTFDTDGNLTLPSQGKIGGSDINSFLTFNYGDDVELKAGDNLYLSGTTATIRTSGAAIGRINATSVTIVSSGTYYLDNSTYVTDYPNTVITTLGGPGPLVNGGFILESTEIFTVGDIITIPAGIQNNTTATLQVTSTLPYSWAFATTGQLNLPRASNGNARIQSADDIDILSENSLWTFGTDGKLTLPGNGIVETFSDSSINIVTSGDGSYTQIQNDSTASGSSYVWLQDGNVRIETDTSNGSWTFGTVNQEPAITFPQGSVISETTNTTVISPPGASAGQSLVLRPTINTESSHIHLISGDPATVDLYLGDDDQYVKVDHSGTVVVGTSANTSTFNWTFDTDGFFNPASIVYLNSNAGYIERAPIASGYSSELNNGTYLRKNGLRLELYDKIGSYRKTNSYLTTGLAHTANTTSTEYTIFTAMLTPTLTATNQFAVGIQIDGNNNPFADGWDAANPGDTNQYKFQLAYQAIYIIGGVTYYYTQEYTHTRTAPGEYSVQIQEGVLPDYPPGTNTSTTVIDLGLDPVSPGWTTVVNLGRAFADARGAAGVVPTQIAIQGGFSRNLSAALVYGQANTGTTSTSALVDFSGIANYGSVPESSIVGDGYISLMAGGEMYLFDKNGITLPNSMRIVSSLNSAVILGGGWDTTGTGSVSIGDGVGQTGDYSVAIGYQAGTNSSDYSVAIGNNTGENQSTGSVAIGYLTGNQQSEFAVAIGRYSGENQSTGSVAIGSGAGNQQGIGSVAIGQAAGNIHQDQLAVAIGSSAGLIVQGAQAVAIGDYAGYAGQQNDAVAIGRYAGAGFVYAEANYVSTGSTSTTLMISITSGTIVAGMKLYQGLAFSNQTVVTVNSATQITLSAPPDSTPLVGPIGFILGQGNHSIAIGTYAGYYSSMYDAQENNTIILNATGTPLIGVNSQTSSLYIAPIRDASGTSGVLQYNTSTKEVTYSNTITATSVFIGPWAVSTSSGGISSPYSGIFTITNTASSISTTTGALQVAGGVGIGGNLYVGGEIVAQKLTIELTTVTTTLIKTDDIIQTTNTTASTGTTTGALVVAGGVGVGGNLFVGGTVGIGTAVNTYTQVMVYNATTASLGLYGGGGVSSGSQTANIYLGDATFNTGARWNQAPGIGALYDSAPLGGVMAGLGLYTYDTVVADTRTLRVGINAYGHTTVYSTASSISTTTGALQVAGGVGVGGGMFVGGTVTATNITSVATAGTTSTTAAGLGYIGMPQNSTAVSYTLVAGDQGKHIYITATGQTITIPANTAVAFPIGSTVVLIAGPSATTVSIAITADTMYLGGSGTTGTRTLAAYGMATAVKVAATTWYINGSGLT